MNCTCANRVKLSAATVEGETRHLKSRVFIMTVDMKRPLWGNFILQKCYWICLLNLCTDDALL